MDYSSLLTPHPYINQKFFNVGVILPSWTTNKREKILIQQMETSHLENTLKAYKRAKVRASRSTLINMVDELNRRKS